MSLLLPFLLHSVSAIRIVQLQRPAVLRSVTAHALVDDTDVGSWLQIRLQRALDAGDSVGAAELQDEMQRLKGQANNNSQDAYAPWLLPRPSRSVDEQRRSRSPGLESNRFDASTADFKKPHGMTNDTAPLVNEAPPASGVDTILTGGAMSPLPAAAANGGLLARVERLERSNEQLFAALTEARAREESLAWRLAALAALSILNAIVDVVI